MRRQTCPTLTGPIPAGTSTVVRPAMGNATNLEPGVRGHIVSGTNRRLPAQPHCGNPHSGIGSVSFLAGAKGPSSAREVQRAIQVRLVSSRDLDSG